MIRKIGILGVLLGVFLDVILLVFFDGLSIFNQWVLVLNAAIFGILYFNKQ